MLTIQLCRYFYFRYSHTAHVVNDNLLLVGGVTPNSSHPPGVVVLHLKSLRWKSYSLPVSNLLLNFVVFKFYWLDCSLLTEKVQCARPRVLAD